MKEQMHPPGERFGVKTLHQSYYIQNIIAFSFLKKNIAGEKSVITNESGMAGFIMLPSQLIPKNIEYFVMAGPK